MTNPAYRIVSSGPSRSFPDGDPFLAAAREAADVVFLVGPGPHQPSRYPQHVAVAVELGTECLAFHTGGCDEAGTSNVLGFARWRLGNSPPTQLVEVVTEPGTRVQATAALQSVLEAAGFQVSVCADRAGRIVDRLLRPQFNLALQAIDDGIASAADLEQCLKLGLGYRNGVLQPLLDSGLEHHFDVTSALFQVYGTPPYAPARQAVVAKARKYSGR
ncbi:MAG: 3-hydroxyacyl-CoA dehydrogenase [Burkholderiaceae bacterium]|nr:3-hydroxyacyl-CoA dehydrogenase [Burkholderiaceae bacterium]